MELRLLFLKVIWLKNKFNIHFLFVFIAAAFWGAAGIFVKAVGNFGIKEMQIVFFRAFFSSAVLGLIILFKNKKLFKVNLKDLWLFAAAGVFSIVLFNFSYYKTMALTSLSVAAVLLYTAPIFVCVLSVLLFREKITINKILALIMAFIGCCFVSGVFSQQHRLTPTALLFGILTGFGYSLYTIFSQILINKGYGSLTITFYTFLFAAIGSLPLMNVSKTVSVVVAEPMSLLILFLMAVTNTVIPYLLYTVGLVGVPTSVAPIIATIEPVVATLISVLIYHEAFEIWHFLGIALVLLSVLVLNLRCKKNEA
ncbi:MAG: hypothetical protein E7545_05195 [Ruminococcaceae bacterium]|nr:hypothetical protein [Oscillospiraceae bacterium]